jgi:DNA-binding transcriptional ArsR family regulator
MDPIMLTISFTSVDLMKTRLASAPDPLWELTLSLHQLRSPSPQIFQEWRRSTLARLQQQPSGMRSLQLLLELVPATGYFPDFLTPAEAEHGFDAGVEAILSTPVQRLAADMEILAQQRKLPSWAAGLAQGEPGVLGRLGVALRDYHAAAIAPFQTEIRASVHIDRSRRARSLTTGGYEQMLAGMRPALRWTDSAIEADYPHSHHCVLDGRGLVMVPSFFCWGRPISLKNTTLPPVLVFPIEGDARYLALGKTMRENASSRSLGALLGKTRAAVLETIADGCTTGEIARRLDVSLATASEHATVLRRAGLVVSVRDGNSMLHALTPVATALLDGSAES